MAEPVNLSIVIPVFNERESISHLLDEIHFVMDTDYSYEVICVDDGSSDGTFEYLRERSQSDGKLRIIRLLRNYGKSAALAEAFKRISSGYVVTLDADLQDDPMEIPRMVEKLRKVMIWCQDGKRRGEIRYQSVCRPGFSILPLVF